jgi:hypothetical protein
MNAQQTRDEANRQIRLLVQESTPDERRRIQTYIRPVPEPTEAAAVRRSGPVHISVAAAEAMRAIDQRRHQAAAENKAGD